MRFAALFFALAMLAVCDRPPSPQPDHSKHDHSNANHGTMDHSTMTSSAGAAEAPHELQFIDTMIAHHRGAIEMAELVDTRSQRPEMKGLARDIITEQRKEIDQMQRMRKDWFGDAQPAVNMGFPGMETGMSGMDTSKLSALKANEFDLEFLRQMIPHHRGAVEMAEALTKDGTEKYAELHRLADSIIASQAKEIRQMTKWIEEWGTAK